MIATPASRAAAGPCSTTSSPSIRRRPLSGRCTPPRIFTSVDLPAPFSPTSACTSPAFRSIETSSRARIAPNAFDACSSERMGCCSVISRERQGVPAMVSVRHAPYPFLEVELVDVRLVEDERRPEEHRALRADLVLAESARGERLARLAGQRARRDVHSRVRGKVAEVGGIPELERYDRAVFDVLAQLVRRAEPGQLDLPAVLRRVEHCRCCGDPDGRRRDDALEVRVLLEQTLRHLR